MFAIILCIPYKQKLGNGLICEQHSKYSMQILVKQFYVSIYKRYICISIILTKQHMCQATGMNICKVGIHVPNNYTIRTHTVYIYMYVSSVNVLGDAVFNIKLFCCRWQADTHSYCFSNNQIVHKIIPRHTNKKATRNVRRRRSLAVWLYVY